MDPREMKQHIQETIKNSLRMAGIGIIRYESLQGLREELQGLREELRTLRAEKFRNERASDDLDFLKALDKSVVDKAIRLLEKSQSQLRQDIFVLSELGFKRDGFFVEFGATNGIDLSNTYLLEKEFSWRGILAEPARIWHENLIENRSANVDFECVWRESGQTLNFKEVSIAELSTISELNTKDMHSEARKKGNTYSVNTISLLDLLKKYDAPKRIDYLSIDTEGSEYAILKDFNFNEYNISVITCEHNYTNDRKNIYDLLTANGYDRKYEELSRFDDWYVRQQTR
jgi:FkbM family methyltransferase